MPRRASISIIATSSSDGIFFGGGEVRANRWVTSTIPVTPRRKAGPPGNAPSPTPTIAKRPVTAAAATASPVAGPWTTTPASSCPSPNSCRRWGAPPPSPRGAAERGRTRPRTSTRSTRSTRRPGSPNRRRSPLPASMPKPPRSFPPSPTRHPPTPGPAARRNRRNPTGSSRPSRRRPRKRSAPPTAPASPRTRPVSAARRSLSGGRWSPSSPSWRCSRPERCGVTSAPPRAASRRSPHSTPTPRTSSTPAVRWATRTT